MAFGSLIGTIFDGPPQLRGVFIDASALCDALKKIQSQENVFIVVADWNLVQFGPTLYLFQYVGIYSASVTLKKVTLHG